MKYYFAYGSNMDLSQMKERCPDARLIGPARLADFALQFNIYSPKRECGCADIVPRPGTEVWGLLFEVTDTCIRSLDLHEGVDGHHYKRIQVQVEMNGGQFASETYDVVGKTSDLEPSRAYLGKIIAAAKEYSFPVEYSKMLSTVKTCD